MKLPPKAVLNMAPYVKTLSGADRDAWAAWVDAGTDRDLTPRAAATALKVARLLAEHGRVDLASIRDQDSDAYVIAANDTLYWEMLVRVLSREPVLA